MQSNERKKTETLERSNGLELWIQTLRKPQVKSEQTEAQFKLLTSIGEEESGVVVGDDGAGVHNDMALGLEEVQKLLTNTPGGPLHRFYNSSSNKESHQLRQRKNVNFSVAR